MRGDQWDTVMNYDAFMEPITWFLTGMEKHSDEFQAEWYGNGDKFFRTMEHNMSKFQRQSLDVAMNELSIMIILVSLQEQTALSDVLQQRALKPQMKMWKSAFFARQLSCR